MGLNKQCELDSAGINPSPVAFPSLTFVFLKTENFFTSLATISFSTTVLHGVSIIYVRFQNTLQYQKTGYGALPHDFGLNSVS